MTFATVVTLAALTLSCKKNDDNVPAEIVDVMSVRIVAETTTINVGETLQLTATVSPDNATDKTVTWSSSNPWVATVDQNGQITAVRAGEATITATVGGKYAYCTLIVKNKEIAVESITLDKSSLELFEGEVAMLYATVLPWNAPDKTVTWTSSNPSVATVDQEGRVTALHEGTAAITAKAGDKTATCTVFVKMMVIPVYWIGLDQYYLEITEGQTATITATVAPDNATDKTVTWSSGNPLIASVDQSGNVTGQAEGTTTITAKAGDMTATCSVTVKKSGVAVELVMLDKTSLELSEGEVAMLYATVLPSNATDKTVTWTSGNPSVATVDQNGKVTGKAEGTTTITAKAGDKTATCSVTVKKAVNPGDPEGFNNENGEW